MGKAAAATAKPAAPAKKRGPLTTDALKYVDVVKKLAARVGGKK
jgi:hypothetical protein